VLLIRMRPDLLARERVPLTALVGTTAYGTALFMYLVDRSGDHIIPYVSLPAVLAGTIWLSLVLRSRDSLPAPAPALALAIALSVATALVAVAWSSIGDRFGNTALAYAVPGVKSGRAALDRLWHFPPIDARAPEGELLLKRHMPVEGRSAVVAGPDLSVEILMRSGRSNRLPWGDPWVMEQRLPGLRAAVARLEPGDLLLTNTAALGELVRRRGQSLAELQEGYGGGDPLTPLEVIALREIRRRFRLQVAARGAHGFLVMRLTPR
jgi:hypothetical protein